MTSSSSQLQLRHNSTFLQFLETFCAPGPVEIFFVFFSDFGFRFGETSALSTWTSIFTMQLDAQISWQGFGFAIVFFVQA